MARTFDLATLQTLANSAAYGGSRTLSAMTEVMLASAFPVLANYYLWQDQPDELTSSEIDQIDELLADAYFEITNEVEPVPNDYRLIAEVAASSNTSILTLSDIPDDNYLRWVLYLSGVQTDYNTVWYDDVLLRFNNDSNTSDYISYGRGWNSGLTQGNESYFQTQSGIRLYAAATTIYRNAMGALTEVIIDRPVQSEYSTIHWVTAGATDTTGESHFCHGVGTYRVTSPITRIDILPVNGSTFYVNSSYPYRPNEIRMQLFGVGLVA